MKRPRLSSGFGKVKYSEIHQYLTDNNIQGYTIQVNKNTNVYSYMIMFRHNKKDPEMLYIEVSYVSKLVIRAWTNFGKVFDNIDSLKTYTKSKM